MLRLVMKDFIIQKKTIVRYILSSLLISMIFFWLTDMKQMSMTVAMAMFPIIYGFMNSALYEDEKNNSLRLLLSLPVSRRDIVFARYISMAAVSVATGILFAFLYKFGFASFARIDDLGQEEGILVIAAVIMAFMVLVALYLPIAFKLGYIKAAGINRFLMLGLFGVLMAFGAAINELLKNSNPPEILVQMGNFINSLSLGTGILVFALAVTLIYIISMNISVRFFDARNIF